MTVVCYTLGGEPADGVLRSPGAPAGPLSAGRRCGGPPADPRGDQQPGHLWLPPGLGDGESDRSYRLQPQADSAGHAAARAHAAPPRVHRRHGRPHFGQIQRPASNQRWCSDVFLIPCWSGEVLSVAFVIDCHDREVLASVASPRPLAGTQIRTLMDRALWARFGEATLKPARDSMAQRRWGWRVRARCSAAAGSITRHRAPIRPSGSRARPTLGRR